MGDGTMEAVYFGSGYAPHGKGAGKGPWIGADMENGIYVRTQAIFATTRFPRHCVGKEGV